MTTSSETPDTFGSDTNDVSSFGYLFLRSGSKLFITGLVLGLIPIAHYMVGGVGHKVGEQFYTLQNMEKLIVHYAKEAL